MVKHSIAIANYCKLLYSIAIVNYDYRRKIKNRKKKRESVKPLLLFSMFSEKRQPYFQFFTKIYDGTFRENSSRLKTFQ